MSYDIEADWQLLNTCNYRCPYCFFTGDTLGEKLRKFASPGDWQSAFDATGKVWLLHLTGGEPSAYPEIVELCEALTQRHYISLNSNLTNSSLARFADRIDPARVRFINAGLHIEERTRRAGGAVFVRHAGLLKEKGFPLLVSLVATPQALARFSESVELLRPVGLMPIPKLLRGWHNGRRYPDAYTDVDRRRFTFFAEAAKKFYAPIIDDMPERPSIDMFVDAKYTRQEPRFHGQSCDAGRSFVSIQPNGDVYRCAVSDKLRLGNLLDRTFKPKSGPEPCNATYCFYFCLKYVAKASAAETCARSAAAQPAGAL